MSGPSRNTRARSAFTLLEVLVALALIILLLGALMGFLGQLQRQRAAMVQESDRLQGVGLLLDRLEGELLCVVAGDATVGAGVKGDGSSIALLSLGAPGTRAAASGLVRTSYTFDPGGGFIRASRSDALATGAAPSAGEIGREIGRLRFRYYARSSLGIASWRDSFDALAEGGLPLAVEVAVWFGRIESTATDPVATTSDSSRDAPALDPRTSDRSRLPAPDRVRLIALSDGPSEESPR